jgi:hypothetical protein
VCLIIKKSEKEIRRWVKMGDLFIPPLFKSHQKMAEAKRQALMNAHPVRAPNLVRRKPGFIQHGTHFPALFPATLGPHLCWLVSYSLHTWLLRPHPKSALNPPWDEFLHVSFGLWAARLPTCQCTSAHLPGTAGVFRITQGHFTDLLVLSA